MNKKREYNIDDFFAFLYFTLCTFFGIVSIYACVVFNSIWNLIDAIILFIFSVFWMWMIFEGDRE